MLQFALFRQLVLPKRYFFGLLSSSLFSSLPIFLGSRKRVELWGRLSILLHLVYLLVRGVLSNRRDGDLDNNHDFNTLVSVCIELICRTIAIQLHGKLCPESCKLASHAFESSFPVGISANANRRCRACTECKRNLHSWGCNRIVAYVVRWTDWSGSRCALEKSSYGQEAGIGILRPTARPTISVFGANPLRV